MKIENGPLVDRIRHLWNRHGSLRATAAVLKVDVGYLSRLLSGAKKNPSDAVLKRMHMERVVSFRRRP